MFGRWLNKNKPMEKKLNGRCQNESNFIIDLRQVVKTYESEAGIFTALKSVDMQVDMGEFVEMDTDSFLSSM